MENLSLYHKLSLLPDQMKQEVAAFIDSLIAKAKKEKSITQPKPKFGSGKGMFEMAPDFDEPLDDFKEYMY